MQALQKILESLHPEVDFSLQKALIDENILDSFDIVTLINEISDEYGINIPVDEIVVDNFNSADAILELIRRLQT